MQKEGMRTNKEVGSTISAGKREKQKVARSKNCQERNIDQTNEKITHLSSICAKNLQREKLTCPGFTN